MPHAYTEDQLVEQPAIGLFAELGWQTLSALEEVFGSAAPSPVPSGHPLPLGEGWGEGRAALGRETKGEVVLVSRLRAAQSALPNPHPRPFSHWEKSGRQAGLRVRSLLAPEAITAAVSGNGPVSPIGETACFSETRLRPVATPYLSGWQAAGVTREFPTSSYLSRKRPA